MYREIRKKMHIRISEDFLDICKKYNYDPVEIRGKNREAGIVRKRWIVAHSLRKLGYPYEIIGVAIDRDHATVMHMIDPARREKNNKRARGRYKKKDAYVLRKPKENLND